VLVAAGKLRLPKVRLGCWGGGGGFFFFLGLGRSFKELVKIHKRGKRCGEPRRFRPFLADREEEL